MSLPVPTDSQVSWQCAFWVLVPCAINTMTQPSGRTCGISEQYRTYLRSSPIFCAIDAIALIVRLFIYLSRGKSFRKALHLVQRARFDDHQAVSFVGGFQALERLTWVRWLIFSLGSLPQVIKLLALHGVPWTKAWGIMFFASFLVFEMFSSALYLSCSTSQLSFWNGVRKSCTLGQSVVVKSLLFPSPDTDNAFRPDEAEAENMINRPQEGHERIQPDIATTNNGNTAVSQPNTPDQAGPSQARAPCIMMSDSELPIIPETVVDTFHDDLFFLDRISAIFAFLFQWSFLIWAYHQIAQPVFNLNYLTHKPAWFISVYHPGWLLLSTFLAYLIYVLGFTIILFIITLFSGILYRILWIALLRRPLLQMRLSESLFNDENLTGFIIDFIDSWIPRTRSDDRTISLWNPTTIQERVQNRKSNVKSSLAVTYSPKGHLMAMASSGNKILLWNPAFRKKVQKLKSHSKMVLAVAFSCDGRQIASASADHTVIIWSLGTKEQLHKLEGHSSSVGAIAFSYDNMLLASGSADTTIAVWSPVNGRQLRKLEGHGSSVLAVAFSRNSRLLASASDDSTVKLWNPESGELLQTLGNHISRFWIPVTGEEMQQLEGHSKPVRAVAFSSDNQLLASASDDCTIRLWDHATGADIYKLEGHKESVRAVAFSYDSRLLASASDDKTVILWSAETGKQLAKFSGCKSSVVAVSFCRDGKLLASASDDNTMRLWNVVTGESVEVNSGPSRKFLVLGFFLLLPCTIWLNMSSPLYQGDVRGGLVWEFTFLVISLLFFTRIIWYATEKQPLRGKLGLLGRQRGAGKRRLEKDKLAVMSFVTFVLTVIFRLLWYQFRYDSTGTYKPGWTDVLG